ncbi:carboxypeptidase B-like isoform X2 [Rhodnius prolixus]
MEEIETKHNDIVSSFTIGLSAQGRSINGIKISTGRQGNQTSRTAVLMDAGMHAREWIAPVVLLYAINQLLENTSYTNLMDTLDWYFVPMINPDGYIFSMDPKGDRLWRKNRPTTTRSYCQGVDLNRNFGYFWGGSGSSGNPCMFSYRGPFPYSEPEAIAFARFVLSISDNVKLYLTLHSSAQAIIYPWGYSDYVPPDWMELDALAKKAQYAIFSINGTHYQVGPTTRIVGEGAGGSDDWAKARAGIKYVYTVELPGPQYPLNGFHPPIAALPVICEEAFEGIKVFAEGIL